MSRVSRRIWLAYLVRTGTKGMSDLISKVGYAGEYYSVRRRECSLLSTDIFRAAVYLKFRACGLCDVQVLEARGWMYGQVRVGTTTNVLMAAWSASGTPYAVNGYSPAKKRRHIMKGLDACFSEDVNHRYCAPRACVCTPLSPCSVRSTLYVNMRLITVMIRSRVVCCKYSLAYVRQGSK